MRPLGSSVRDPKRTKSRLRNKADPRRVVWWDSRGIKSRSKTNRKKSDYRNRQRA